MSTYKYLHQVAEAEPAVGDAPSKGPTYRNIMAKDGFPKLDGINNLWELITVSEQKFGKNPCLGTPKNGDYEWLTYSETLAKAKTCGAALRSVGLQANDRCGVYGTNCAEWMLALQGCLSQRVQCVPLYDTLGADAIEFIVKHASVSIAVVQETKLAAFAKAIPACTGIIKTVVSMGGLDESFKTTLTTAGIAGYTWEEFLALGASNPVDPVVPEPEDFCTIMYTSGTTGEPKGVLLKHKAVVLMIASLQAGLGYVGFTFGPDDVYLSYLPLAHIFDYMSEFFMIERGARIGYWRGDVKVLVDDIGILKPTFFVGVPRIFDRIYTGVTSKIQEAGFLKKFVFDFAYRRKLTNLQHGATSDKAAPLMDRLVFGKVKERLGGRVRLILSGAAPLARHVEDFLKVAMCAPVVQGYGLTETCAGSFITYPDVASMAGTVGPAFPNGDVRLESIPDMNYDALGTPARGEICMRGDALFSGYYKREDLTKEVMVDGWFHSGDVGEWQPDGCLKIIDRKKNIFKLSQGEYVAVETIENALGQASTVDVIWVYGNSFESCLVAVVTPNEGALTSWAKTEGLEGDYKSLCSNAAAKEMILKDLEATGRKAKLKGFEMVKAVYLDSVPFDMERDLLTPTFKKKRPQLLKYYKEHVDAMYEGLKTKA